MKSEKMIGSMTIGLSTQLQALSILLLFVFVGCGANDSVEKTPTRDHLLFEQSDPRSDQRNKLLTENSPDYDELIDILVKGSSHSATAEEQDKADAALSEVDALNKDELQAFAFALEKRLTDKSPEMRMEAAWMLVVFCDSPARKPDLVPVLVELLTQKDILIKLRATRYVADIVAQQELEETAKPLVAPLITALDDPKLLYASIMALKAIGPTAKDAVPSIRRAAERANDETINKIVPEAIRTIEMHQ